MLIHSRGLGFLDVLKSIIAFNSLLYSAIQSTVPAIPNCLLYSAPSRVLILEILFNLPFDILNKKSDIGGTLGSSSFFR